MWKEYCLRIIIMIVICLLYKSVLSLTLVIIAKVAIFNAGCLAISHYHTLRIKVLFTNVTCILK